MQTDNKQLRLIFPQWQGGGPIDSFVPELTAEDSFKGYNLGSQLLNFLAPATKDTTVTVPISLDIEDREEKHGIIAYESILKNTDNALKLIRQHAPERIVTLGGECSVSVVPFAYLAEKYQDNIAIVWVDAHPDLNYPGESGRGYHAMALAMLLGKGDEALLSRLPATVPPSHAIIAGLRAYEKEGGTIERQRELGIKSYPPEALTLSSEPVIQWLKSTGAEKVLIHFDLDVIDPGEMIAAVGTDPNGMKIHEVSRLINDISAQFDIVGLTIAEHMPRVAIQLKNLLSTLPMLK